MEAIGGLYRWSIMPVVFEQGTCLVVWSSRKEQVHQTSRLSMLEFSASAVLPCVTWSKGNKRKLKSMIPWCSLLSISPTDIDVSIYIYIYIYIYIFNWELQVIKIKKTCLVKIQRKRNIN
jgi:hypothetical protein